MENRKDMTTALGTLKFQKRHYNIAVEGSISEFLLSASQERHLINGSILHAFTGFH